MSLFHNLTEEIWGAFVAIREYRKKYPEIVNTRNYLKTPADHAVWQDKINHAVKKVKTTGDSLKEKMKMIQDEISSIQKNTEDLATLKKELSKLHELLNKYWRLFTQIDEPTSFDTYSGGVLPQLEKNIHEINNSLNTCHNLFSLINKNHRFIRREEKRTES